MSDEEQTQQANGLTTQPITQPEVQLPTTKAPLAVGHKGIEVRNWDDLWRFATVIAKSDLAPKDYRGKPENCLVAIQYGMELGVQPMQALQNIAVVNGRPSIWGDLAMAMVEASGLLVDKEESFEGEGDELRAVCVTQRRNRKPHRSEFSIDDAKTAGLWKKQGPWTTNPKRMLQMRARGFNLRDNFPDVLKGMLLAEEVIDITPEPAETPADESKVSALQERLAAAQGKKAPAPAAPIETTATPVAEPAKPVETKAAEEIATDPSDVIRAINRLVDDIEGLAAQPGAGIAALRKVLRATTGLDKSDLDGLTAEKLAEAWAALKVEHDNPTKAAVEGTKGNDNGSLFGE